MLVLERLGSAGRWLQLDLQLGEEVAELLKSFDGGIVEIWGPSLHRLLDLAPVLEYFCLGFLSLV